MTQLQFQVFRSELARTRWVDVPPAALADGHVRVRVEHFAYTANNITYAAFGDAMQYWQFFPALTPAGEGDAAGWGCIPVWGFGTVEASRSAEVAEGERLYGYWPMASHAVLQPARVTPAGFMDGAPHRAALHAVYNQLLRCAADPMYTPDSEGVQALLRRSNPQKLAARLGQGDLELDRETRRVRRAGREIHLGPTEFRLLEHLLERPGRVYSRAQLLDSVWGMAAEIVERTVDVHVGRLRKALSRGSEEDPIRTVRGAGYSFDETFGRG